MDNYLKSEAIGTDKNVGYFGDNRALEIKSEICR